MQRRRRAAPPFSLAVPLVRQGHESSAEATTASTGARVSHKGDLEKASADCLWGGCSAWCWCGSAPELSFSLCAKDAPKPPWGHLQHAIETDTTVKTEYVRICSLVAGELWAMQLSASLTRLGLVCMELW
ncbi:hypothetical protein AV530_003852 [Patagioenas fasciata monilis]|uniref:Uncharacterized protein n=1 Tax=Patagioenas fasciata monilis TaxID=372326 RepID=A0A1V4KYU4_PATFA|nr:hypothetical protein AV530_003852 [Patagioenas fasciata monilis]